MTKNKQLLLRIFAGPNGSGKSTVIKYIRNYKVSGKNVDFGFYINADDIATILRTNQPYRFDQFGFQTTNKEFKKIVLSSGLVNKDFNEKQFLSSYTFRTNYIRLKNDVYAERIAQIIADFIRKKLLELRERFSFETVFSHESKLDIMRQANAAGYKVYLYFVSTESPEINKFRVRARVAQKGHDVPEDKIESRYQKSMDLLYEACQLAFQVFFFDNSRDISQSDSNDKNSLLFANFKLIKGEKDWTYYPDNIPTWFFDYYLEKAKPKPIN